MEHQGKAFDFLLKQSEKLKFKSFMACKIGYCSSWDTVRLLHLIEFCFDMFRSQNLIPLKLSFDFLTEAKIGD